MLLLRKVAPLLIVVSLASFKASAGEKYMFTASTGYLRFLEAAGFEYEIGPYDSLFLQTRFDFRIADGFYFGFLGQFFSWLDRRAIIDLPYGFEILLTGSYHFPPVAGGYLKPYLSFGLGGGIIVFGYGFNDPDLTGSGPGCISISAGLRDIVAGFGIDLKSSVFYPNLEADKRNVSFTLEIGLTFSVGWGE